MSPRDRLGEQQLRGAFILLLAVVTLTAAAIAARSFPPPFFSNPPAHSKQTATSTAIQLVIDGSDEGIYFFEGRVTLSEVLKEMAPKHAARFQLGSHLQDRTLIPGDRLFIATSPPSIGVERMEPRVMMALGIPFDLNRASAEDLAMISGIGPVTAEAVIALRNRRGAFTSLEELKDVRGIGEKRFQDLKRYLTLDTGEGW